MLEQQLDEVDSQEPFSLFLGLSRSDRNTARTSLLSQIDTSLADYGTSTGVIFKRFKAKEK